VGQRGYQDRERVDVGQRAGREIAATEEQVSTIADLELVAARLAAILGPCAHPGAVPVESLDGEVVAWLCPAPDCGRQLPAGWLPAGGERAAVRFRGAMARLTTAPGVCADDLPGLAEGIMGLVPDGSEGDG
jgi:hypothetical protein